MIGAAKDQGNARIQGMHVTMDHDEAAAAKSSSTTALYPSNKQQELPNAEPAKDGVPITTSQRSVTSATYKHIYPLPVKIERFLDPSEFEFVQVEKSTRGSDLKAMIRSEFDLESSFNILVFHRVVTSESGIKRRMVTDRARIEQILSFNERPTDIAALDFSDFVALDVNEPGAEIEVTIRIYELTVEHLREQIEKHFKVKNTQYNIFGVDQNSGRRTLIDQNSIKDLCGNGSQLIVERVVEFRDDEYTTSDLDIPRSVLPVSIPGEDEFDCMLSYAWATKEQVHALAEALLKIIPNIKIWIDRDEMNGNINTSMARGILKSTAIIVCLSKAYLTKTKKPLIPVYMFGNLEFADIQQLKQTPELASPFIMTAGKLYADFGASSQGSQKFDDAVALVVRELKRLVPRLRESSENSSAPTHLVSAVVDELKTWLKPIDFASDLAAYKKDFVEGTRVWLGDEVRDWANSGEESSVMWVNGAAGTGKSLFSYFVTQYLQPKDFITNVYFFCRHNDDLKNDPVYLVRTLVWMLCEQFPGFRLHVEAAMIADQQSGSQSTILSDPYSTFFRLVVGGFSKAIDSSKIVLITIDALDELNIKTREVVLRILTELCPRLPRFVKFFVTGRPEKDIYDCLTKISSFELEPTAQENLIDVEKVVVNRLKAIWNVTEPFTGDLLICKDSLVAKSEGVFIFIKLVGEYLASSGLTPQQAKVAIQSFSSGPDDVYSVIAQKTLAENGRNVYHKVFGTILFVNEPFDLESLSVLSATPLEQTVAFFESMRSILKIVGGKISLIHKSAKDFFTSEQRCKPESYISAVDSNRNLAAVCLDILGSYLKTTELGNLRGREINKIPVPSDQRERKKLPTLTRYAIQNVVFHLNPAYPPVNQKHCYTSVHNTETHLLPRILFKKGADIEANDIDQWTPLYFAVAGGHLAVVVTLIQMGANIHSTVMNGWTPLYIAAWDGHRDITEILLEAGANVNARTSRGRTPLLSATSQSHREVVKVLINFGVNVNDADSDGWTAVYTASASGDIDIVELLIAAGANVNVVTSDGWTPLRAAARYGYLEIVKILISAGSEVDTPDFVGETPLYCTSYYGHEDILGILLAARANVNTANLNGVFPLHCAAQNGHKTVVAMLLRAGANANCVDVNGKTPLIFAAEKGHKTIMELLVMAGAKGMLNAQLCDLNQSFIFVEINV
ncbi:hypothetical protein HDU79_009123 [Rhizoclosmatium sp. JEL0117]|nr:hypothetical protein HDU79_009123 [Rhizoclosmatium sp. JEL0117]